MFQEKETFNLKHAFIIRKEKSVNIVCNARSKFYAFEKKDKGNRYQF